MSTGNRVTEGISIGVCGNSMVTPLAIIRFCFLKAEDHKSFPWPDPPAFLAEEPRE